MLHRSRWYLLFLGLAAVAGCEGGPPPMAPPGPPDVVVSKAIDRVVTDYEEFYGKTQAEKEVDIRARVSGYLDKILFKEGAEVHEKDVLCEIDPRPFAAELERAEANVAQAEAHLKHMEYDYGRAQRLLPVQGMSREDYDKAAGDLAESRANVKAAVAARNTAKLNLEFSKVTSPVSGKISRRYVDPGNMVKADDTIITRVVTVDPMLAYFDVDERTYLRVQQFLERQGPSPGTRRPVEVSMGLSDRDDFPLHGTIDFVDNRVDPDSGSVWLRGRFPNPDGLLKSGLFVRVRLPLGEPHKAVLIPEQALATDQGQKFVYAVDREDHARRKEVKFGAQHGQWREVKSGIAPGERVVVSGQQRIRIHPDPTHPDPEKDFAAVRVTGEKEFPLESDAGASGRKPASE